MHIIYIHQSEKYYKVNYFRMPKLEELAKIFKLQTENKLHLKLEIHSDYITFNANFTHYAFLLQGIPSNTENAINY